MPDLNVVRDLPNDRDRVFFGACVELEDDAGEKSLVFLGPSSGGIKVRHNNLSIQIITPAAPLGKLLLAAEVDDEVTLDAGKESRSFLVSAIF